MVSLRYRVHEDASGWRWEVLTRDGQVVAGGSHQDNVDARGLGCCVESAAEMPAPTRAPDQLFSVLEQEPERTGATS
jgi:hypothetical protein